MHRPLNLIWRRQSLDLALEWHFITEVLLAGLDRPVRHFVLEDDQKVPLCNDTLIVTLGEDGLHLVRVARKLGLKNIGLLHLGDEYGQNSRDFYAFADYVLRHYWFSDLLESGGSNGTTVVWVPNGYRTGVGPMDPARTLPFGDRKIEAFFAGAMHEGKPDNEREIMRATIKQAQLPFVVYRTQGFGQGLSPSSYAAFLGNSKFALVPSGNSPETVRLYDVLEHGCIPIMLKSPFVVAPGALAAIGPPPLILLDSWQDLPVAYAELSEKPESQLEDQRLRILDWWTKFKSHQQARVREVIEASFAKRQGTT